MIQKEIEFMITWEHSKKTYIDVEKYLIDSRPVRDTDDMLGVRDYKYLKQELRWLIKERNLKICEISRILLHMIEIFARNQFTCTYSTPEYHQKFEDLEKRLSKIAQLLFTYQKLIVIYSPHETLEKGVEEFNKIWKNMTLQELFLLVLEKKSEGSLIEFVSVFKPEILNNYYTLFYEVRRQLRDMPMKTLFMKMDFLLPLSGSKLEEIKNLPEDPLTESNINRAEIGLWDLWEKDKEQALFCKQYAKTCSAYSEWEEVDSKIIPSFLNNREKNSKKYIFSTVDGIENLATIKEALQSEETYMKLVKQFTQLYGEADFSLMCIEAAIKEKGFGENEVLRKEYINLSLYSILVYDNNLIDIEYAEFKTQKTLQKFCQIISQNPTNPGIILSSKIMKLFDEFANKPKKFLKILQKFIHHQECTPFIFNEVFKCIQNEFDEESKNSIFLNMFKFICEKLQFEHHDYLEEYVDMLTDKIQKEKIQLYSNMSRIIFNFGINKNVGYFEQFVNFDENRKDEDEQPKKEEEDSKEGVKEKSEQKPKEGTTNKDIIERGDKLIEDIIEKYVYNNVNDKNKQVALDRSLSIIDIRKITHMKTLLNFIQEKLLNKVVKKGDPEGKLLRKLLECEKFDQFRDLMSSTSLSVEDVDRIILLNIRNTFKKYQIGQIKRYIVEHFSLLRLDNPTRIQEKAFFDLACMIHDPPINIDIPLQQLRKKDKFDLLRQILKYFSNQEKIKDIDFFSLHKYLTLYEKPDEEYEPFKEPEYQLFLRDYALNLESVEKIVDIIDILKNQKSSYVSDLCYYLITEFDNLTQAQRKRFTQLGLLECQDEILIMDIVSVIHQNKINTLPLKEVQNKNNSTSTQSQQELALIKSKQLLGKENSTLTEIKEGEEEQYNTQESISSKEKIPSVEQPKQQQQSSSSSSRWSLKNIFTNVVQGVVGGTSQLKEQLITKGSGIRIFDKQIFTDEIQEKFPSNQKEVKNHLYQIYEDLLTFISKKQVVLQKTEFNDDGEEQESEQNQIENRKKQIQLFCKLLTRAPSSQAFYHLALNKNYFDLQLISEIIMKLLSNIYMPFNNAYLINQMVRICIFRLTETPKYSIFAGDLTKSQIKDTFISYLEQKYQKTDPNRKIFERFYESFILMSQLSYFKKYIKEGNEHQFLFDRTYRNAIIVNMISESGNLEIFEKEPDIFRMEDFNTKDLIISSINSELKKNDLEKCVGLWKKIVVFTKSEQTNQGKSQQQIDQSWMDTFRKLYEKCSNLKALIELLDRVHSENKEIFDKFIERKAFQLLKSLNNVSCDVDMSKYVKFEQIFKNKESTVLSHNTNQHSLIKLRDHNDDSKKIFSKGDNHTEGGCKTNDSAVQSLKQINKHEIRQDLEEYNVFVLARVLGYFIEGADNLVYYLFTKKLLRIKDIADNCNDNVEVDGNQDGQTQLLNNSDEMYNLRQNKDSDGQSSYGGQSLYRRDIVEIMVDRINSLEYLSSQIAKLSKKTESDQSKLKKYRTLLNLMGEKEKRLAEQSLIYNKYTSSNYQIQTTNARKHMSESLYLRMTRHIESSKGEDALSDKTCIWRYFETLLTQESTNLLDCSECKCLVTEFIQSKFTSIISVYENASVEFRANFGDIVYERVEDNIKNFCMQAPLRKQLLQLLERIQLNMENVDTSIFDVIVQSVLQQNSNDSINIVLISTKDSLLLTQEQNSILLQLSAVLRMSFLLQDTNIINQMKLALTQNITSIDYFIEKYLREAISKVNQTSSVSDIIKLKYLAQYLKNTSLIQELVLNCAENLSPNILIQLLTLKYLSFEDIDVIDNTLNQSFISAYNSFVKQTPPQIHISEIIATILKHENEIDQDLFYGFILQYIGAAAFKKMQKYKDLFDVMVRLIERKEQYEQTLINSRLSQFKTEIEFTNYLDELKTCFKICTYKSIDDLIINNMIDLANEQKYYDAAKLNYIYKDYPKEQSSVSFYLQKLKDDIQPIQTNQNLSDITLKKLKNVIPEILKIC